VINDGSDGLEPATSGVTGRVRHDDEQKRFRKLFKQGQHARAVITVKAKDNAGNTSTSRRTVAVRR
jgi:hypothetical protein